MKLICIDTKTGRCTRWERRVWAYGGVTTQSVVARGVWTIEPWPTWAATVTEMLGEMRKAP